MQNKVSRIKGLEEPYDFTPAGAVLDAVEGVIQAMEVYVVQEEMLQSRDGLVVPSRLEHVSLDRRTRGSASLLPGLSAVAKLSRWST